MDETPNRSRSKRAGWSSGSTARWRSTASIWRCPEGAIYGILGPNGAGKTTTLRMLLGIIDPDEGVRRIFGHDRPHEIAKMIGYLPEERGLYPSMKCDEAIGFMGCVARPARGRRVAGEAAQ